MVTRNVVLTDAQDKLIQSLVTTGRFQNVSEAMRAGLRLLEHEEAGLQHVREGLREGLAQVEVGDFAQGTGTDAIRRAFSAARTNG
jgi:antitoxin ParD1/3/4